MLKKPQAPKRNQRCPCGSGRKFKHCCLGALNAPAPTESASVGYIDEGEAPVRYVITNHIGTSFFSTKDNAVIVFKTRADAFAIATLPDFQDQDPGEINVAGVGPTKWQHLQEKLPYVEIDDVDVAAQLIRERIDHIRQEIENTPIPGEELSEYDPEKSTPPGPVGPPGEEGPPGINTEE